MSEIQIRIIEYMRRLICSIVSSLFLGLLFFCCLAKFSNGIIVSVFTNGSGNLGSIPGRVIPKTQKKVLDATWLNTQHYKVKIKGKVKQSLV